MEKDIKRQAPAAEQADVIENSALNESPENGVLKVEDIPNFPINPDSEDIFREERIVTEDEGQESAPLSNERDNDYYHETTGILPNQENRPGDLVDEEYEQLGREVQKSNFVLNETTYESIPKPREEK